MVKIHSENELPNYKISFIMSNYTGHWHNEFVNTFIRAAKNFIYATKCQSEKLNFTYVQICARQEVDRCRTWGESEESVVDNEKSKGSILALKPRIDVISSPNQEYHGPFKKDWCPPKRLEKIQLRSRRIYIVLRNSRWLWIDANLCTYVLFKAKLLVLHYE